MILIKESEWRVRFFRKQKDGTGNLMIISTDRPQPSQRAGGKIYLSVFSWIKETYQQCTGFPVTSGRLSGIHTYWPCITPIPTTHLPSRFPSIPQVEISDDPTQTDTDLHNQPKQTKQNTSRASSTHHTPHTPQPSYTTTESGNSHDKRCVRRAFFCPEGTRTTSLRHQCQHGNVCKSNDR